MPLRSKVAIDLGAGNGIQSVALAELGFRVKAVDFNTQLLSELESRKNGQEIEIINDDIRAVSKFRDIEPELIVCCGDTVSHLNSLTEVEELIKDIFTTLTSNGKVALTFRDYSNELKDTSRFIPVKSDSNKILTCLLEFFPNRVRVTDILHEKENGNWKQKVSSYEKVRISKDIILKMLKKTGFEITLNETINRMITIIAQK